MVIARIILKDHEFLRPEGSKRQSRAHELNELFIKETTDYTD